MSRRQTMTGFLGLIFLLFLLATPAPAQNPGTAPGQCRGPIYSPNEVAKRAKIIEYADTSVLTKVATQYNFRGTIHAYAVLCRSGHVTDVQVTQKLPQNLDEFVVAAMVMMKFKPAELNWHTVSQRIKYELSINDDSKIKLIDAAQAAGRLVEEVDIVGNRRMDKDEILRSIKTRPGEPYSATQVGADLQALFNSRYFDKLVTRVSTEDAPRGGVRVIFEDNGIGIEKQAQERIFGIFERLSSEYQGTGIGLAIVKKAAEKMGGSVGVRSEPGKGSRFWVELERAKADDKLRAPRK
jgi:hypothetical protein